jgi:glycosyltransferase involved in cell wall biosynthesis
MDRKIRVLCVPSDTGGCGLHRSLIPHQKLYEMFNNEFDVDINYKPDWKDLNYIGSFDIIHFHKGVYNNLEDFHNALAYCKKNNITTVMDVDDYWELGQAHPLFSIYRRNNMTNIIRDNLYRADYVTTTTPIFANKIKKFNPNVKVFVNSLDQNLIDKIKEKKSNGKLRIGFVMGSTHKHDMELVRGMVSKLPNDILNKVQFVLCGYDLRGSVTEISANGETKTRALRPEESVWFEYEKNITDNYRIVSPLYKDFLLKFMPQVDYPNADNETYKRCWTKTVDNYDYMKHYNEIDILFVPLQDNEFNRYKSELKFAEAGIMNVGVVASNFGAYTIGSVNFFERGGTINKDGNCILIENNRAHKDWSKAVEKLVKNPEYVEMLKTNMHNHIMENYNLEKITAERARWYKEICKKNGEEK